MNNYDTPLSDAGESRRSFIRQTAVAAAAIVTVDPLSIAAKEIANTSAPSEPWYRTITRWGQVNITEKHPERYYIEWRRKYWKRTATQGVVINAGGIVAYYPSKIPLHQHVQYLNCW
jgi:hypothetical protein